MNLAIVSDELSRDFRTVVEVLDSIDLKRIELRNLRTGRVPRIDAKELAELEKHIKTKKLDIQAISPGIGKISIDTDNLEEESRKLFKESLEFAVHFGVKRIIVFTFRKRNKYDLNECIPENVIDLLVEFYTLAENYGIEIVVENHSSCYMSTVDSIISICNHPKLKDIIKINWDPNNSFLVDKQTYCGGLEKFYSHIESIHIKDTYYDGEFKRAPILEGQIGWDLIFRDLARLGYNKDFTSETHYEPRIANSKNDLAILRNCIRTYF